MWTSGRVEVRHRTPVTDGNIFQLDFQLLQAFKLFAILTFSTLNYNTRNDSFHHSIVEHTTVTILA